MGGKVTFDPINKIINIVQAPVSGFVNIDVQSELYSEGKRLFLNSPELIKYDFPVRSVGGDPLPGSRELGRTYFITPPWRIKPYEADHTLRITGNLYMEDGSSPYIPTSGEFTVNIESQVSNLIDGIATPSVVADAVWSFGDTGHENNTIGNALLRAYAEALLSRKTQTNKAVISEDRSTVTIFDDDGASVLLEFEISPDQLQRVPK